MKVMLACLMVATMALAGANSIEPQGGQVKKFVTPEDAKRWESLSAPRISNDGRWFAYGINVNDGDGRLVIRNCDTAQNWTVPVGSGAVFSEDSKWVAYSIGMPRAEADKLRAQRKPIERKMGLRNLANGNEEVFGAVQSHQFLKTSKHLLVHKSRPEGQTKGGTDLHVVSLVDDARLVIGNVVNVRPNEAGTLVALGIESTSGESGIQLLDPEAMSLRTLHWSRSTYPALAWAEKKDTIAFLVGTPNDAKEGPSHEIMLASDLTERKPTLKSFDPSKFAEFPKDHRIVEFGGLEINDDGTSVGFGIQAWKDKAKPAKPEDQPTVDIWHYKDVEVQPFQLRRLEAKKRENYQCVWRADRNLYYQIGNDRWTDVTLLGDHRYALVADDTAHETPVVVGGLQYADYYVVEIDTGDKQKVLERRQFGPVVSPEGNYLAYYKQKNWWIYDFAKRTHTNVTEKAPATWENVDNDHTVSEKPPAGFPYWLEEESGVIVYDKYDAYLASVNGSRVTKLTDGGKDRVICRLQDITQDEYRVRAEDPMVFSLFDEIQKTTGYLRREPSGELKVLMLDKAFFSGMVKAKDADRVFVSMQTFEQPPTILLSNQVFSAAKPIASVNPQQREYHWGKSELIHFKNKEGKDLQGILMYPAGYEEGKTYPMITYIYEKLSNGLYQYRAPNDAGTYNPQLFLQSGYFIFMPDIVYRERNPGLSALDCVNAGVDAVLAKDVGVDPKKLGLMGHSWGGYQTAFIVTQTNRFTAANAGAPLTELRSMYNSFYWNAGITDQVIFESSQGRMAVPWWEDPKSYTDNNPLDHATKIQTPLLVEFGDQDGAVDFHQGQQLYNTLRRMGKPIVMLVYNGENHNNARRPNQVDYAKRQRHFFDVFLKGANPEPWLSEGIPMIKKGDG